jgi:hypothetical protein
VGWVDGQVSVPVDKSTSKNEQLRFEAEWRSYMLPYELPDDDIQAARVLLSRHTAGNVLGKGLTGPLRLEPRMVQALYALQLELDASLPITLLTFLRLDVDHRSKQLESFAPVRKSAGEAKKAEAAEGQAAVTRLLVAVAHADNMRPMMGASGVDGFCRLTATLGGPSRRKPSFDTEYGKYYATHQSCHWGQIFQFELPPEVVDSRVEGSPDKQEARAKADDDAELLRVDCFERLAFIDFTVGTLILTRRELLRDPGEVKQHDRPLQPEVAGSPKPPSLKLASVLVSGDGGLATAELRLKRTLTTLQRKFSANGQSMDLAELTGRRPSLSLDEEDFQPVGAFPVMAFRVDVATIALTLGIIRFVETSRRSPGRRIGGSSPPTTPDCNPEDVRPALMLSDRFFRSVRNPLLDVTLSSIWTSFRFTPGTGDEGEEVVTNVELGMENLVVFDHQVCCRRILQVRGEEGVNAESQGCCLTERRPTTGPAHPPGGRGREEHVSGLASDESPSWVHPPVDAPRDRADR